MSGERGRGRGRWAASVAFALIVVTGAVAFAVTSVYSSWSAPPAGANGSATRLTRTDVAYGPDPAHRMDLYLPSTPGPHPVVLWLHSGGWIAGDKGVTDPQVQAQVARGWAVASANYRLAPGDPFPRPIQDVKRAIRTLKVRGPQWGLRSDRVVVAGHSAGGHLAALAGASPGSLEPEDLPVELAAVDSSVSGVIDLVGPTDLFRFGEAGEWGRDLSAALLGCPTEPGTPGRCWDLLMAAASPVTHLTPAAPPAYLVYGRLDTLVRADVDGAPLAEQWRAVRGGRGVFFEVKDDGHNLAVDRATLDPWLDALVAPGAPTD